MENKSVLIQEDTFEKARKKIRENKSKQIIFSGSDELNRKILEKENVDVLLLNLKDRKDRMKQRNSGFNQVLAKIAKKKNVIIGINFDEIVGSKGVMKARILGRLKQNIMLCNKNKLKMKFLVFGNKRNGYDLKSLGLVLGMPTWMIKDL